LNLLSNSAEDKEVRAKAQYALSGLIKHFPEGLAQFQEKGGFDALADIVKNPQGKLKVYRSIHDSVRRLMVLSLFAITRRTDSAQNHLFIQHINAGRPFSSETIGITRHTRGLC
jgi:hypothetical protein